MPVLYTLIVKRKSQTAFSRGNIELFIDDHFRGLIKNGQKIRFLFTKDTIKLQVRDAGGINIIPFKSQPVNITSGKAKEFEYEIQYGISDFMFILMIILFLAGFFIGTFSMQPLYYLLSVVPFISLIGFRLFNKEHYLFIESEPKEGIY